MIRYDTLLNKNVRVITLIVFKTGRKIKIDYVGKLISNRSTSIDIMEIDRKVVTIEKRFIKRIEENNNGR